MIYTLNIYKYYPIHSEKNNIFCCKNATFHIYFFAEKLNHQDNFLVHSSAKIFITPLF